MLTLAMLLLIGGYLLLYSGFTRTSPIDQIRSTFRPTPKRKGS